MTLRSVFAGIDCCALSSDKSIDTFPSDAFGEDGDRKWESSAGFVTGAAEDEEIAEFREEEDDTDCEALVLVCCASHEIGAPVNGSAIGLLFADSEFLRLI